MVPAPIYEHYDAGRYARIDPQGTAITEHGSTILDGAGQAAAAAAMPMRIPPIK